MDLKTKLRGLVALGLSNVGRALLYARARDRADRRFPRQRPSGEPVAPGKRLAVTPLPNGFHARFEQAEVELVALAPDLLRVTWQPGRLPVPYMLAEQSWPQTTCQVMDSGRLETEQLAVELDADGQLTLKARGKVIRREAPPTRHGEAWTHQAALAEGEVVLGLGERTAPLNLVGGTFRLWNLEAEGTYGPKKDPLYICVPTAIGLHADGAYLVFFENAAEGRVTLTDGAFTTRFEAGALRYYLAVGEPARTLLRYGQLTGRAPLPPRFALGYHQSRWSYRTEAEVRAVVDGFAARKLPLDVLHLDIDYMDGFRVFTVDPERFPDLPKLCADLDEKGIKVITILDPGVKVDQAFGRYVEGRQRDLFLKLPNGEEATAPVWPGTCAFPDFTHPEARRWWGDQYEALVKQGVAGVWHDMNEPAAFAAWGESTLPRATQHHLEGQGGDHVEAHNLYGLLEARAGAEGLLRAAPHRRPWLLTRSGTAGIQRYAWTWTGDCEPDWWTLHQSLRMALSLGLSGVPYSGPDIGGFNGTPTPELYARWFALASCLPFFRTHSAAFVPRREPWTYGKEVTDACRRLLLVRQRLLPYLYTVAEEVSRTGWPFVRPAFWAAPTDPSLWTVDDLFFVGDALLVLPVLEPGATLKTATLPPGRYADYLTGDVYHGGETVTLEAPLGVQPMLIRAGFGVAASATSGLLLQIFPDESGHATASVYSDAGDGFGPGRRDVFCLAPTEGGYTLTRTTEHRSGEDGGTAPWTLGELVIHLVGVPLKSAQADGKAVPLVGPMVSTPLFERLTLTRKA